MNALEAARLIACDYYDRDKLRILDAYDQDGVTATYCDTPHGHVLICQGSVTAMDWVRNFSLWPEAEAGVTGALWHGGMLYEANAIWDRMSRYKPAYILGHSRGAGVGQPLAIPFMRRDPTCKAILFAAPKSLRVPAGEMWPGADHPDLWQAIHGISIWNMRADPVCWAPPLPNWEFFGVVAELPAVRPWFSHRIPWYIKALEQAA